ncbi:MAG TPA: T9SS type A sorting domain-containing protein, partial [Saprospiraceae bacterium]|nr:T9SS type A sorting domain-containing protein [Saprospiraceae bacterium]
SVAVRDANQCLFNATFLIASLSPSAPVLLPTDTVLCAGESTVLSTGLPAPFGYVYQWQVNGDTIAGANASELLVLGGGTYRVRLVGQGCNSLWSAPVQVDQEFAIAPTVTVATDTLDTSTGWAAYQWLLEGEAIPGATGPQWIAKKTGSYSVQVVSSNGCPYTSLPVQVDISSIWLPPAVRHFSLLPNPAQDQFTLSLQLAAPERIRISLTDLSGQLIFQQSRQAAQVSLPIQVQALPAGTYLLRIELSEGYFTRQVVKL